MNNIAGIPYVAARFDKDGAALNKQEVKLPAGTADVIVASHGWNNTEEQADRLYIGLVHQLCGGRIGSASEEKDRNRRSHVALEKIHRCR